MDSFILACARSAQVDLKDYGLSDNLHEFLEETKKVVTKNDMRFKKLFKAVNIWTQARNISLWCA